MSNRNPVKQVFITFPKSNVDKSTFRDSLLRFEPEYYKVCEEKHKDGTPHLHAVIKFKNKYSKSFILEHYKKKYPDDFKRIDVENVRSIKKALAYLSKEDTAPLESGNFKESRGGYKAGLDKFSIKELGKNSWQEIKDNIKEEEEAALLLYYDWEQFKLERSWMGVDTFEDLLPWKYQKVLKNIESGKYAIPKDDITFFYKEIINK